MATEATKKTTSKAEKTASKVETKTTPERTPTIDELLEKRGLTAEKLLELLDTESTSRADRPQRGESRADRPKRNANIGDFRGKLDVRGKDPNYHYRWVCDDEPDGQEIFIRQELGYEFVDATTEKLGIGERAVMETSKLGSIYRKPSGDGRWLFLMRQPKEYHEEDLRILESKIRKKEEDMIRSYDPDFDDGRYGKIKQEYRNLR